MHFPTQKILSKDKDLQWVKTCADYIISEGNRDLHHDISRMLRNYRLMNSQLETDEFRSICKSLGVNEATGKKYIGLYNKTPNFLYTLSGEELDRSFSWGITNIIDQPIKAEINDLELKIKNVIDKFYSLEVQKIKSIINLEIKQQSNQETTQEEIDAINKSIEDKYAHLIKELDSLKSNYSNLQTEKEKTVTNLLKIAMNRMDFKWLKNECFQDIVIAGKEFCEIRFEHGNPFPVIRQLNPLNVFYHKSPDTPYTHDSDYAGYKEEMTLGQVIDLYGHELSKEELKRLQTHSYDGSRPYGITDTFFHTKGDRHASSWAAKRDAGMFPSGSNLDADAEMVLDGKYAAVPTNSISGGNNIYGPGLYSDNRTYSGRYLDVYTTYWKSYVKSYKYSYFNEYGKLVDEIVDESFVIPSNHKVEKYKPSMFSETIVKKVWYDDEGKYNCVEEIWIPEIWKAVRINGEFYVNIGPVEGAYQSLTNPYKTKIPIFGYVFSSRNSEILSIADRLAPWQKLYLSVMARLIKNLSQDKGVLTFFNALMADEEIGVAKTLAMAEDGNIIPYNPLAYTKGSNMVQNTMKVAESINASNSEIVQYYISLLEFIEGQMQESVGMSPQRLAKTNSYTTATDNQRDVMHSMNITEPLFYAHDLLWEKICQSYMEMLLATLSNSDSKIRGMIDDNKIAIVDLGLLNMEDEYLFKVSNNIRNNKIMEILKANTHAFIQNDKARFSTLLSMLKTDDLYEFEKEILDFERKMDAQKEAEDQAARDHEKEMRELEIQNREDIQIADLYKNYLMEKMKKDRELAKEDMKGKYMVTSYNLQSDADKDGISDIIENEIKYKKFINEVAADSEKIDQERQKLLAQIEELNIKNRQLEELIRSNKAKEDIERSKAKSSNNN
jgi:hypothetical protein